MISFLICEMGLLFPNPSPRAGAPTRQVFPGYIEERRGYGKWAVVLLTHGKVTSSSKGT